MTEMLGDIRLRPDVSPETVTESIRSLGYVVLSDTAPQLELDQRFRTEVIETQVPHLIRDIHGEPPLTRTRIDGLIEWRRLPSGLIEIVRDYPTKLIQPRSFHPRHREYPIGMKIVGNAVSEAWMQTTIGFVPEEILGDEGSVYFAVFETGARDEHGVPGKVVERMHQDGELLVGSCVQKVIGGGADTTLHAERLDSSQIRPAREEDFNEIARFNLGEGDMSIHDDVGYWHKVWDLLLPADGSDPLRRAFIFIFAKHATHQWLQEVFSS